MELTPASSFTKPLLPVTIRASIPGIRHTWSWMCGTYQPSHVLHAPLLTERNRQEHESELQSMGRHLDQLQSGICSTLNQPRISTPSQRYLTPGHDLSFISTGSSPEDAATSDCTSRLYTVDIGGSSSSSRSHTNMVLVAAVGLPVALWLWARVLLSCKNA